MNKKVEVIIGVYPNQISLDLADNAISIALQYAIDDVRNIDKKNTNYSKTITVPGTKKNNKAFGSLFDVNATFDQFNPNLKIDARIVVDSSPVLEGYLQLNKVKKLNNADLQGNKISYEVVIFDDSIDFIQSLGDKTLINNSDSDFDLDFSSFNHTYNETNITNAWANTYDVIPYQYPLLDSVGDYTTKDFKPSFYHKALLLKIAENAGYSLEGSFIDNEGSDSLADDFGTYHKELIMWDGETPKISDTLALTREFKAGLSGTSVISLGTYEHSSLTASFNSKINNNLNYDTLTPDPPYFDNTGGYTFNNAGGSSLDFSQWECTNTGKYTFTVKGNFTLDYAKESASAHGNVYSSPDGFSAVVKGGVLFSIVDVDSGVSYGQNFGLLGTFEDIPTGTLGKFLTNDLLVDIKSSTIPLNARVKLVASSYSDRGFGFGVAGPFGVLTTIMDIELKFNENSSAEFFNKTIKEESIEDGDEIEIGQYLPKEIKQKDIVTDIVRRYNVYIKKHATKTKTLVLETRDDYYKNNVTTLNWTQKKDYSSEDNIKFLSDLQNKEILFTYKEANDLKGADDDAFNKFYQASTGDIYGQKLISFDNDFVKGTKKIESIFSTAPLTFRSKNNVVVPSVSSANGKRKPVLCYWGGLVDVKDEEGTAESFNIKWGTDAPTTYTTYPFAGHYDNPYTPTLDIHYGEVTYEYYNTLSAITSNNLFNRYWRNQQNQIKDGKLITSKFYLKETDINFIKDNLNSRIFIKDSYYIINKVVDYKPLEDGLTTVELLRIEEATARPLTAPTIVAYTATETFISTLTDTRTGPFRSSVSNDTRSSNVMMLGERNYIGENVTGSVNGNDNSVFDNSSSINIIGDGNTVGAGLRNVTIVGDNQTATESNTSIINGNTLNTTTALASERIYQELEIGSWDWSASFSESVNHGLSVTEWKTIRNVDYTIINDADDDYQPMTAFGLTSLNATSFDLLVGSSGGTDYDDSAVNRGFITFTYIPD